MKVSELLEYTAKEYLDDRTEMLDGEPDELWSDKTLVRYFNEAQRRLCRRAWLLKDVGNASAGILVLATGKALYKLHSSVLRVHSVTPEGAAVPLARTTDLLVTGYAPPDADFFDVNQIQPLTPGAPLAFTTDAGTRLLRIVPTPAAGQNGQRLILQVTRMPVCLLSTEKPEDEPEVPEEYQLDGLCKYAAGKCLTHPNVDATAKTEGRQFLREFEALVEEARQDRQRAEHAEPKFQFASVTAHIR